MRQLMIGEGGLEPRGKALGQRVVGLRIEMN